MNLYSYSTNDPLNYVDPYGDDPKRTPAQGQPPGTRQSYPAPGGGRTDRHFGDEGRARTDYDYGHDHGQGDPHAHDWDWSKPDPRQPGRPLTPDEPAPDPLPPIPTLPIPLPPAPTELIPLLLLPVPPDSPICRDFPSWPGCAPNCT